MSRELLSVEGTVTPSCSKSHITYVIHLHRPCRELHVEFAYEPKILEDREKSRAAIGDALALFVEESELEASRTNWERYYPLKNLLTLSFDDENGFRGAAHRHDPVQRHIIAENEASPGLIRGIIPRGQLRITISVHCVITDECRYRLRVREGGDDREAVAPV